MALSNAIHFFVDVLITTSRRMRIGSHSNQYYFTNDDKVAGELLLE